MLKYIVLVLVIILSTLAVLYFRVGVSRIYEEPVNTKAAVHIYGNPEQSIERIHITGLYFIPRDNVELGDERWYETLEQVLQKLAEFHKVQFMGTSQVTYTIIPTPIVGLSESRVYGTDVVYFGNPSEMKFIVEELKNSPFEEARTALQNLGNGSRQYEVVVVMYEGVGAASAENVSLISRLFLTGPQFKDFGTTYLAHEFYHSLEVPEGYIEAERSFADNQKIEVEALSSPDVMGRIRVPIEQSYLSRETLSNMGL